MSDQTQPKITRLNAPALSQVFDRVTVQALLNMVRVTGNETDGPTVPGISLDLDDTKAIVVVLREQVEVLRMILDYLGAVPPDNPVDMSAVDALQIMPQSPVQVIAQQVEHIQTEVRQIAEQVAKLMQVVQSELRPGFDSLTQFSNQIIAETRQLADQQIVNANLIQEIKQGTML